MNKMLWHFKSTGTFEKGGIKEIGGSKGIERGSVACTGEFVPS